MKTEGQKWAFYEDETGKHLRLFLGEAEFAFYISHPETTLGDFREGLIEFIRRNQPMIDWMTIPLALYGDIAIDSSEKTECRSVASWYPITAEKWEPAEYTRLNRKELTGGQYYRLTKPDWTPFSEWLRVYYNEKEQAAEFRSPEERAYQTIIGILIGGGSAATVEGDIWFEVEQAKVGSIREQIMAEAWAEINSRNFPKEPEDEQDDYDPNGAERDPLPEPKSFDF